MWIENKTNIVAFFLVGLVASLIIMVLSIGWLLIVFSPAILFLIILHIIAGIRALKNYPTANKFLILSTCTFLLFFLIRVDMGDQYGYNGLSSLLYYLNIKESSEIESADALYAISIVAFFTQLVLDILLFRKAKSQYEIKKQ